MNQEENLDKDCDEICEEPGAGGSLNQRQTWAHSFDRTALGLFQSTASASGGSIQAVTVSYDASSLVRALYSLEAALYVRTDVMAGKVWYQVAIGQPTADEGADDKWAEIDPDTRIAAFLAGKLVELNMERRSASV